MYPPPPGSAPGYHELHHCTAKGIINKVHNNSLSDKSGKIETFDETTSLLKIPVIPPTSGKLIK